MNVRDWIGYLDDRTPSFKRELDRMQKEVDRMIRLQVQLIVCKDDLADLENYLNEYALSEHGREAIDYAKKCYKKRYENHETTN